MSIAFLACVESGYLETQAALLFRSIRKYGGKYKDAPIYSYQPRVSKHLKPETLALFNELGVVHITEVLNKDFHDYPIGNKIFVCAHAEKTLKEDILVFLDSDTVFVGEPSDLDLPEGILAAARPADNKNYAYTEEETLLSEFWDRLYAICEVAPPPFVETTVDNVRIRAYWNAGLIAVRREAGLFNRWKEDFLKLMAAKHLPPRDMNPEPKSVTFARFVKYFSGLAKSVVRLDSAAFVSVLRYQKNLLSMLVKPISHINNMDQMALSATFSRVFDKVRILDYRYNYPIPKRHSLKKPMKKADFDELIHVHYHRWFNKPGFLSALRPPLDSSSEIFKWLEGFLPFQPIIEEPMRYEKEGGLDDI